MKVLFVNPIIYTSETKDGKKRDSIKDTMSYGLCCAFKKAGHDITLYACEDYKPVNDENYPFTVVFEKANGLPVVAFDCGGNNIILDSINDYYVKEQKEEYSSLFAHSLSDFICDVNLESKKNGNYQLLKRKFIWSSKCNDFLEKLKEYKKVSGGSE